MNPWEDWGDIEDDVQLLENSRSWLMGDYISNAFRSWELALFSGVFLDESREPTPIFDNVLSAYRQIRDVRVRRGLPPV